MPVMKTKRIKAVGFGMMFWGSIALGFGQSEGEVIAKETGKKSPAQLVREAAWQKGLSGNNQAAHEDLKAAIGSAEGTARWHLQYGTLLTQLTIKQLEREQLTAAGETALKAQETLQEAVRKIPDEEGKLKAAALTKLAYVQGHFLNDNQLAEKTLQQALALDPENEAARQRLRRFAK